MGRKSKAAKMEEMAQMSKLESTKQSLEKANLLPENTNPSPERTESEPKSFNSSLDNVEFPPESINLSSARAKTQPKLHVKPAKQSYKKKRMRCHTGFVRRSERIHNTVMPARNKDIESVIEEITLSESEKEDEPPAQMEQNLVEQTSFGKNNLGDKIEYILRQLEMQGRAIEALKSEATKNSVLSGSPFRTDLSYKSLYIDAQKKNESLTEENQQLALKVENTLRKLEANESLAEENQQLSLQLKNAITKLETYENGNHILEKLKEVILASNLAKATETAANVSSQALHNNTFSAGVLGPERTVKRKKV